MSSNGRRRTRILINSLSARSGGGQTYVRNLLEFWPKDAESEIFLLAPDSLELSGNVQGIQRIFVHAPVANPFLRAVWERARLPNLIRRLDANVFFSTGGIIGARLPENCKSVTMFRNMIPFHATQEVSHPAGYQCLRNAILRKVLL